MSQPVPAVGPLWHPDAPSTVVQGDNLKVLAELPDASFRLIYLDPPFNTGRPQARQTLTSVRSEGVRAASSGSKAAATSASRATSSATTTGSRTTGVSWSRG